MSAKDVMAHLREQGVTDLREVKAAYVEDDGGISVIRRSWAEPAKVSDIDDDAAEQMKRDLRSESDPSGANRTDAPEWLR